MDYGFAERALCVEANNRDCPILFLLAVAVAAHELVHATCGVDKLLLTGEEGV